MGDTIKTLYEIDVAGNFWSERILESVKTETIDAVMSTLDIVYFYLKFKWLEDKVQLISYLWDKNEEKLLKIGFSWLDNDSGNYDIVTLDDIKLFEKVIRNLFKYIYENRYNLQWWEHIPESFNANETLMWIYNKYFHKKEHSLYFEELKYEETTVSIKVRWWWGVIDWSYFMEFEYFDNWEVELIKNEEIKTSKNWV